MSCEKTAEPIKIQFGTPSRGGSRKHVLHHGADASTGSGTFGVLGRLKSIVEHNVLGGG